MVFQSGILFLQKFFDSGDYAMNKDKAKNPGNLPPATLPQGGHRPAAKVEVCFTVTVFGSTLVSGTWKMARAVQKGKVLCRLQQ